jgi:hypothetical protein
MEGLYFDFENNDIVLNAAGSFVTADIGSQNCALISTSQICRLTKPEIGEQLAVKLLLRKGTGSKTDIARSVAAVQKDGGTDVSILLDSLGQLSFKATYVS